MFTYEEQKDKSRNQNLSSNLGTFWNIRYSEVGATNRALVQALHEVILHQQWGRFD